MAFVTTTTRRTKSSSSSVTFGRSTTSSGLIMKPISLLPSSLKVQHCCSSSLLLLFVSTNTNDNNNNDGTTVVNVSNRMIMTSTKKEEKKKERRSLDTLGNTIPSFSKFLDSLTTKSKSTKSDTDSAVPISLLQYRNDCTVLQINIGLLCNQACSHCHVDSSPLRIDEQMSSTDAIRCLEFLKTTSTITTLDLTGGAPELNVNFRYIVSTARLLRPDIEIIDRCNLTILLETDQEDLITFLKQHNVRIVASLPCYSSDNVDKQRGKNVFDKSIHALQLLNQAGYGCTQQDDTNNKKLQLDLVYNPNGAFLPPSQETLQVAYKEQLMTKYGIQFNNLLTITNMPIKKFADYLYQQDMLLDYMTLLVNNFNPATLSNVMCLNTVSISWDGYIYDCDFNQQLGLNLIKHSTSTTTTTTTTTTNDNDDTTTSSSKLLSIYDIDNLNDLKRYKIRTDRHCFGCTAGAGSSCQGATV